MLQLSVIRTPTTIHNHAITPPFLTSKISATHRRSHRRKPEHIRLISNSTSSSYNSISSSSSSNSSSVTVSSSVMSNTKQSDDDENTKQSDDDELHIPLLCPPLNQSVAAIVFGDDSSGDSRLYPLTKRRSEGAIPIGANYRLIDAVVSNCINSSITKIYALTQFNSTSLNSHLSRAYSGAGLGKQGFVEVIAAYQSPEDEGWFQGTADAVRRCLWVLEEHPVIEFLVLPGHHLYRMNYQKLIEAHRNSNADITLAATFPTRNRDPGYGFVKVAKPENKVTEFLRERPKFEQLNHHLVTESSKTSKNGGDSILGSMGIYVIKRDAMIKILREYFPKANDFATEIIPGAISMGMKVHCYAFDGYWEDLTDIQSFYQANMESTKKATSGFNFYDRDSLVYTLPRCLPPTLMMDATVTDSVIGDGCILNMCDIKRSVIGMRTWIGDRVLIEDSVLMGADIYHTNEEQRCEREGKGMNIPIGIGEGSHIRKAIIDKNVRIGKNVRIINRDNVQEANREAMGYIISGGIVIVLRSAVIPDGSIL